MSNTIVLNFYAGPGCGKSTICAGVFSWLKNKNVNCEMSLELAKDLVWEKALFNLSNQIYVFGIQHHRLYRLLEQVDVIITDAPLLHTIIYDKGGNPHLTPLVLEEHRRLRNVNVFLERVKPFNPKGRVHNEEEARIIDTEVRTLLDKYDPSYLILPGEMESIPKVGQYILDLLGARSDVSK